MDILAKKHISRWLISLLVVMNLVALGALWYSVFRKPEAPPRRDDNRPENVRRFLKRELDLAPEQSARFEDLRKRNAADIQSLQNEIRRLKRAEMDELLAARPDRAKIDSLAVEIGTKEAEKEKLLMSHLLDLMALCRPDQQEKFRSIMGELLRMMGPPGQQPGEKPPAKRPPERPGDKPPAKRPAGRGEPPPRDRR